MLSEDDRLRFLTIADYVGSLGYRAKRDKTPAVGYTFSHPNVKSRLLRFVRYHEKPVIKIKYYASQSYSHFFQEALRRTIEEFDYRYTGCYGCGKCDGRQGYTYRYPDGRDYFRCGSELIDILDINNLPLDEALNLLKTQHEFFLCSRKTI